MELLKTVEACDVEPTSGQKSPLPFDNLCDNDDLDHSCVIRVCL